MGEPIGWISLLILNSIEKQGIKNSVQFFYIIVRWDQISDLGIPRILWKGWAYTHDNNVCRYLSFRYEVNYETKPREHSSTLGNTLVLCVYVGVPQCRLVISQTRLHSLIEMDPILKLLIQLEMKINKYRKSALFEKCLLLIYYH